MSDPQQPEIVWERIPWGDGELVRATHPGVECVFIDRTCSCGVLDIGLVRERES